jgi:hypothetical protein
VLTLTILTPTILARCVAAATLAVLGLGASGAQARDALPWPDTSRGVHVFNDQLPGGLPGALLRFAARHYDGTQKMLREDARRLRRVNRRFLILHYRLGEGLGYRTVSGSCEPRGDYIQVVEGNRWVREWPSDPDPDWFYPYGGSRRVLLCDWGWYLTELDSREWRRYWHDEVLRQVVANLDDGVFMDSLSVPNYFGSSNWDPDLPEVDSAFEREWARKIEAWLAWLQRQPLGRRFHLVPNVGSWITTRDTTSYSRADGVMVEGFAIGGDASPYAVGDWRLQANRILGLVRRHRAVIGQSYVSRERERMFALGSYLLFKHGRFYLNLEHGMEPEWWPEYELPIGRPKAPPPRRISALHDGDHDVYRRRFSGGEVLVNPDEDGGQKLVRLGRPGWLALPRGGGTVPESARKPGRLVFERVRRLRLGPYSAAVVLDRRPA